MTESTPDTGHPRYRPDIDGLRAVAVLSVVGFHAFPAVIRGGFTGVDIFFVISGFLISSILFVSLERGSFSIADFYARRIRRIFPSLIVIMLATMILGAFCLYPLAYGQLGKHVAAGAAFVQNLILYSESGYFDGTAETKPLLHLWSLAVEEQFYIFWPLMLAFVWKRKWNFLRLTIVIAVVSFAANIQLIHDNPTAAFYWPVSRFWELMIGGVLSYIALHASHLLDTNRRLRSAAGFVMVVAGLVLIRKEVAFPGWWGLLPTMGAALIISAGPDAPLNRHILCAPPMVALGKISYPLYLWHWPLLVIGQVVTGGSIRVSALLIGCSFVLAWLTYVWIEKPIRKSGKGAITLLAVMVLLGCTGFLSFTKGGLGSRLSEADLGIRNISKVTNVLEYFHYRQLLRDGLCHSVPFDRLASNGCIDIRARNLFIWGDSYAASLYPGMTHVRDSSHPDWGITQLTDGNGPPFSTSARTDDGKLLSEVNAYRVRVVQEYRPDVVVITWMVGGINAISSKKVAVAELLKTVHSIRAVSPKTRVVIFGPFPNWRATLLQQLFGWYVLHRTSPPLYMSHGLTDATVPWDDFLKANLAGQDLDYISAYDCFCNSSGCLTRTGNDVEDLVAVDYGHLTEQGSIYLANRVQGLVFRN